MLILGAAVSAVLLVLLLAAALRYQGFGGRFAGWIRTAVAAKGGAAGGGKPQAA